MKNKKNNKKVFALKRIKAVIIVLIVLLIIVKLINGGNYITYRTEFPISKIYKEEIDTLGYNILNEKVYKAEGEGIVLYNASEGQKVPVGYEIATVNLMNDVSQYKDDLIKVNAALSYKKNNIKNNVFTEKEKESIENIQKDLIDGSISDAIKDINGLDFNTKQSVSISELTELINLSEDELESKRDSLEKKISLTNRDYNAEFSGIVSYKIDGLEEYYTDKNLSKITYAYLNNHSKVHMNEPDTQVKNGDNLFKEVDNFSYKLAISFEDMKPLGEINKGDKLKIESDEIKNLAGTVIEINKSKSNSGVIILEMYEQLESLYSKRIHKFKVIKENKRCLEIPKTALIKRGDASGVYVNEIHSLVRFTPVKIIKLKDSKAYIEVGDKNGCIMQGDEKIKTVTINDAVVTNPNTVEERHMLN